MEDIDILGLFRTWNSYLTLGTGRISYLPRQAMIGRRVKTQCEYVRSSFFPLLACNGFMDGSRNTPPARSSGRLTMPSSRVLLHVCEYVSTYSCMHIDCWLRSGSLGMRC